MIHDYDVGASMFVIRPCAVRVNFFAAIKGRTIKEIALFEIRVIDHTSVEYEYQCTDNEIDQQTDQKYFLGIVGLQQNGTVSVIERLGRSELLPERVIR